jgi:2-dehydropantoate 2-reductase
MHIQTVSIIGLGALGVLFGHHLSGKMPEGDLRIIADEGRIRRYQRDHIYCNGERCRFHYIKPGDPVPPADLILFCVKYNGLSAAIEDARSQVGPDTLILSLLNGISSEQRLAAAYGAQNVLASTAQGMDALKVGNALTYRNMGMICLGDSAPGAPSPRALAVARFFERMALPHQLCEDMPKRLWGKFMLNVGVNQAVTVFETNYGGILRPGEARDTMIRAMREVIPLSEREGVPLSEVDVAYWLDVLSGLNPAGKPSMRQDIEAGRPTEVELFSGTVLALARKHGIACPVNQMLYDRISRMEARAGS